MATVSKNTNSTLVQLAAFVIVVAGIKAAAPLIIPFLLAIFLAIISAPLLFWFARKGVPEVLGLILILALVIGLWALLVMAVGSSIDEFSRTVPEYQRRLGAMTAELWSWLSNHGIEIDPKLIHDTLNPGRIMRFVAGALNGVGGLLTRAFLILLTFIFLLLEASGIPDKIKAIQGEEGCTVVDYAAIAIGVNRYFTLKTITCLATGIAVYLMLTVFGVNFAMLWALVAFFLNFIPNIGSILAAVPAVLLALIQFGPGQALFIALGYLAINTVIGSIIEPRVMGRGIGLSVLVVFISLSFWGWVLGPVGMLLSVPLTMAVKIALGSHDSTRWMALLLGSNSDVSAYLARLPVK